MKGIIQLMPTLSQKSEYPGWSRATLCMCQQKKPDRYRCICSSRDRHGFYADFQISFGGGGGQCGQII